MYNPSSSSLSLSGGNSSQGSMSSNTIGGGLIRYGSAPTSLLNTLLDSAHDFSSFPTQTQTQTRFFHSETNDMPKLNNQTCINNNNNSIGSLYQTGGGGGGSLVRHSSSPAGFLNKLASADNGYSITKWIKSYDNNNNDNIEGGLLRLNSQLSFTREETVSLIFEESELGVDDNRENGQRNSNSWDDGTNQIMFDESSSKRVKIGHINVNGLDDTIQSQFQFNMPEEALEMATMENLLHIPQDSIACKIRAKRGFATHPRSIAERERRTRISGKLKKLQDLVPNMDKQTSYSDMLDLAIHHIKSLQNQLQKLDHELEGCTCGCKNTSKET